MKAQTLRSKSVADLKNELIALLQEQFNLRMQRGMGEAPKSHNFCKVRRNVARVKTVLNEKLREKRDE